MSKNRHSKSKHTTRIILPNELIEKINLRAEIYDISFHDALDLLADDAINGLGTALNLVPAFKPVTPIECRKAAA